MGICLPCRDIMRDLCSQGNICLVWFPISNWTNQGCLPKYPFKTIFVNWVYRKTFLQVSTSSFRVSLEYKFGNCLHNNQALKCFTIVHLHYFISHSSTMYMYDFSKILFIHMYNTSRLLNAKLWWKADLTSGINCTKDMYFRVHANPHVLFKPYRAHFD